MSDVSNTPADAAATPIKAKAPIFCVSVRDMGTLIGLPVICAVFAAISDVFLTERNLINILQQSSINACIAIGMTMVIISGGIDLSVDPVALAAVLSSTMLVGGYSILLSIGVALAVGV